MKWLIVPLESFSPAGLRKQLETTLPNGKTRQRQAGPDDLPWAVRAFLSVFPDPFIVLDESSKIKSNAPMAEHKKSHRTRLVKLLNRFGQRCIMTGTFMSKSPVNALDQVGFLKEGYIPESEWEFAERYCVMETIVVNHIPRRIQIREGSYTEIRKRLKNAYIRGGEEALRYAMHKIYEERGVSLPKQEHIIQHKKYTPFINQAELRRRLDPIMMTVRREDVFDIRHDAFVTEPIMRPVELSAKGKSLAKDLVNLGFTDRFTLGKAPALELLRRVQDVCNGFEPVLSEDANGARVVTHRPLADNPKLEGLLALLGEIDTDRNQAVVWCSRRLLLDACAEAFGKEGLTFARYDGSVGAAEKAEAEERFQSGEARIFLANPASGAYGLNCLAQCSYAIFICIDDSVETYRQATHRILRGQLTAPKFSYHIFAKGTVEERQLARLRAGQELLTGSNTREAFDVA